jgi:hypothetical protein
MAFYQVEPYGPERIDLAAALVASTVAEINRDPKSRSKPYTLKDFLPKFNWEEPEPLPDVPPEELEHKVMDIFRRLGGTVARKVRGK